MPSFCTDTRNFSDITQCPEEGVSLTTFKSADVVLASLAAFFAKCLMFNLQSTPLQAEFCTQVFFSKGKL